MIRQLQFITLLSFFSLTVGCSGISDAPEVAPVIGSVTIDGKPAANVMVTFTPADGGRPSQATTNDSGQYELFYSTSSMGAKVGKHLVSIANPDDITSSKEQGAVPKKYAILNKEVEVKGSNNTIDLVYP